MPRPSSACCSAVSRCWPHRRPLASHGRALASLISASGWALELRGSRGARRGLAESDGGRWLLQRVSELVVIASLFGTGLKLDRPLTWRSWSGVGRLLVVAMPLTIAAVALFQERRHGTLVERRAGAGGHPGARRSGAGGRRQVGPPGTRTSARRTSRSPARPGSTTVSRSRFSSSGCSSRRKAGAIGSVPGCWPTSCMPW